MPPTHLAPDAPQHTRRCLSFCEREEIAILLAQGATLREIARKLERSPGTISRGSATQRRQDPHRVDRHTPRMRVQARR